MLLLVVLSLGLFFLYGPEFPEMEGGSSFGTNHYVAPQDTMETNLAITGVVAAEEPNPGSLQTSADAGGAPAVQRTVTAGSETNLVKSFTVGPTGKLVLNVGRGGIRVVGADQATVEVRVTRDVRRARSAEANRFLAAEKLLLKQSGSEISISSQEPPVIHTFFWRNLIRPELDAHYEISVPRKFELRLKDASGGIQVASMQGRVNVSTLSGGLDFDDIEGKLDGGTMSGRVHATGCRDELVLHSMSGGIIIEKFSGPNVQAHTASGSVSADFASTPKADCDLHSMSGGVTARLPADCAFRVDAHTMSGGVRTDFPVQVQGRVQAGTLRGTINGGGPLLKMETMSGGIQLLKRGETAL
jgi:hypothetical protein